MNQPTLSSILTPLIMEAAIMDEAQIPVVYCDMDGVVADFQAGMRHFYNLNTKQEVQEFLSQPKMWLKIGKEHPNIFSELPVLPDARRLMTGLFRLKDLGYIRLNMLTALPVDWYNVPELRERGRQDKQYWMSKNFPQMDMRHVIVVTRAQKVQIAVDQQKTPRRPPVLIDDYERNVKEWTRKGRGIGILHKNAQDTLLQLNQYLLSATQDDFQGRPYKRK